MSVRRQEEHLKPRSGLDPPPPICVPPEAAAAAPELFPPIAPFIMSYTEDYLLFSYAAAFLPSLQALVFSLRISTPMGPQLVLHSGQLSGLPAD